MRIDRLSGFVWRVRHRTVNRFRDCLAWLTGYCNDCPWRPDPGEGGGYSFWRCAKKRGHEGLHRSRNYVWADDGRTDYLPADRGMAKNAYVQQPHDRYPTHTLRQQRQMAGWHERQLEKRRAMRKDR